MNHLMSHLRTPSFARRRRTLVAVAALAGLALAGCSSSKSATPPATTSTRPAPPTSLTIPLKVTACELFFPRSDVKQLFGAAPDQEHPEATNTGGKSCFYGWSAANIVRSMVVSEDPGTKAYGAKIVPNAKPYAGLGDEAFVAAHSISNALIIQFVKGGKTYGVTYTAGGFQGVHADPSDQVLQLETMLKAAAAKIA